MEKKINAMQSDLVVFYHKLQCYHWYVKGNDFFVIHTTLQKCYEEVKEQLDELAESALMIGYSPVATMKDFTKMASIKEAKDSETIFEQSLNPLLFHNINISLL